MTSRRDFAKTLSAAALGYVLHPLTPSPHALAPKRKLDRIGLQLYTVRHQMEKDFEGTIARVAATGYREVEFAGYFGRNPRDVRALLDHHGRTGSAGVLRALARTVPDGARQGLGRPTGPPHGGGRCGKDRLQENLRAERSGGNQALLRRARRGGRSVRIHPREL